MNRTWTPPRPLAVAVTVALLASAHALHGANQPAAPSVPAPPPAAPPAAASATATVDAKEALLQLFEKKESITNSMGLVMVWVPAGFRVAKYEITQSDYEQVMGRNPSKSPGARRPVESVSVNEARAFCQRLTEKEIKEEKLPEGYTYALPTEADFDAYVTDTPLSTAIVSLRGDRRNAEDVGLLPANPLGLHDVRGNVWEWCDNATARGASYQSHEDYLATTFRYTASPDQKVEDIGFRVLLKGPAR